jgi:predicted DsbA family dithiol-disulfide isomerase
MLTRMQAVRIDVWSDIACPWCHVGKRRLEAALEQFPQRDAVELVWRSFELDPSAPRTSEAAPYAARLARKYGSSVADAQSMIDRMTETAARDGLDFHFEKIRPGNTFDAHRLLHLAHTRGLQDTLKERLFLAYLGEGEAIGDPEVLARLAVEAGLEHDEVRRVLASDAFAAAVRADEEQARSLGIRWRALLRVRRPPGRLRRPPLRHVARRADDRVAGRASTRPRVRRGSFVRPRRLRVSPTRHDPAGRRGRSMYRHGHARAPARPPARRLRTPVRGPASPGPPRHPRTTVSRPPPAR